MSIATNAWTRRPVLWLALLTGFMGLSGCALFGASYRPEPMVIEARQALEDQGRFQAGRGYYAVLPPADVGLSPAGKREAIIFYPGGKVEPLAYLPLWELVSRSGYAVFVPTMPLDLAVFDVTAARRVRREHGEYEAWHIAGHSLGGAMAAEHVKKGDTDYQSLMLLGSYPAESTDLSGLAIAVLSIKEEFGLEGGLEKARSLRKNLPPGHTFRLLYGGNHAQFGRYGIQGGDGTATITPEEQAATAAEWIIDFLSGLH